MYMFSVDFETQTEVIILPSAMEVNTGCWAKPRHGTMRSRLQGVGKRPCVLALAYQELSTGAVGVSTWSQERIIAACTPPPAVHPTVLDYVHTDREQQCRSRLHTERAKFG